jgi:hypothetical protein
MNCITRYLRARKLAEEKRRLIRTRQKVYRLLVELTRQIQAITAQEAELHERRPDQ